MGQQSPKKSESGLWGNLFSLSLSVSLWLSFDTLKPLCLGDLIGLIPGSRLITVVDLSHAVQTNMKDPALSESSSVLPAPLQPFMFLFVKGFSHLIVHLT